MGTSYLNLVKILSSPSQKKEPAEFLNTSQAALEPAKGTCLCGLGLGAFVIKMGSRKAVRIVWNSYFLPVHLIIILLKSSTVRDSQTLRLQIAQCPEYPQQSSVCLR